MRFSPLALTIVAAVAIAIVTALAVISSCGKTITAEKLSSKLAAEPQNHIAVKFIAPIKATFGIKKLSTNETIVLDDVVTRNFLMLLMLEPVCNWRIKVPPGLEFKAEDGAVLRPTSCWWDNLFKYGSPSVFRIELGNGSGTPSVTDYKLFNFVTSASVSTINYVENDTLSCLLFEAAITPSSNITVSESGLALQTKYGTWVLLTHSVFPRVTLLANETYLLWVQVCLSKKTGIFTSLVVPYYWAARRWPRLPYPLTPPPESRVYYRLIARYGTETRFAWDLGSGNSRQRLFSPDLSTVCLTVWAWGSLPSQTVTIDRVVLERHIRDYDSRNYYRYLYYSTTVSLPTALNITSRVIPPRAGLEVTFCLRAG